MKLLKYLISTLLMNLLSNNVHTCLLMLTYAYRFLTIKYCVMGFHGLLIVPSVSLNECPLVTWPMAGCGAACVSPQFTGHRVFCDYRL